MYQLKRHKIKCFNLYRECIFRRCTHATQTIHSRLVKLSVTKQRREREYGSDCYLLLCGDRTQQFSIMKITDTRTCQCKGFVYSGESSIRHLSHLGNLRCTTTTISCARKYHQLNFNEMDMSNKTFQKMYKIFFLIYEI